MLWKRSLKYTPIWAFASGKHHPPRRRSDRLDEALVESALRIGMQLGSCERWDAENCANRGRLAAQMHNPVTNTRHLARLGGKDLKTGTLRGGCATTRITWSDFEKA